jgi:protein-S-isoprenylcysteine O-methyltransferase Ste14
MKATQFEFRFRVAIVTLLYVLGFWAPWEHLRGSGAITTTWLELAGALASAHWLSLQSATILVTVVAILLALKGTFFRLWGTAYLGTAIVHDKAMHAAKLVAAGPYRYTRNPLYLGTLLFSAAVSILMPPSGAILFLLLQAVLYLRLILGEEAFLSAQQGQPYLSYKQQVTRFFPSLRPRVASAQMHPQWLQSLLAESYYLALTACFAILAWQYNAWILTKCVIICFGASLILKSFVPKNNPSTYSHD